MKKERYFQAVRYVAPLALVGIAVVLEFPLSAMVDERGFMLLYPAVFAGAVIGGLLPGILCTLFASVSIWFLIMPGSAEFSTHRKGDFAYLVIFTAMGLIFSSVSAYIRRLVEHGKQARERLNLALKAAGLGSWDWDLEKNQVWRSEGHDLLFGVKLSSSSGLAAFLEFVHPDDRDRLSAAILDCIQGKEDYAVEYRVIWPDRSEHWLLTQGKVIRNAFSQPVRLTGCSLDVTERKAAENRRFQVLNTSCDNLENEKHLREKFVATLSHDLRNPLAAAKAAANLLLRYGDSLPSREKLIKRIITSTERADRMIADFLDASWLRAGQKLPIQVERCRLRVLLSEALDELSVIHGNRFVLNGEGPDEIEGFWCPRGLRRVIENLVNNAVKYGIAGAPITVAFSRTGERVQVSVHNEGIGLRLEEKEQMFDAFQRTRAAEQSGERGWGLGLTLVRGIVDAHGGSVRVESAPERGATFTIELPLDSRKHPVSTAV